MENNLEKNVVLYVGGFILPDKNAAAHRVINNGKILHNAGYEVVFLGIGDSCKKETYYGFECWSMPYTTQRLYSISRLKKIYSAYKGRVAAIVAYNYPAIALWKLFLFARKQGCAIFADCTEWYGIQGDSFVHSIIKGFDSFLRMRIIQPHFDGLIAISSYLQKYYENKLSTILLPVLVDLSDPIWYPVLAPVGTDEPLKLVFAGTLGRNKDKLNELIEVVLYRLHDIELHVIGMECEDYIRIYPQFRQELEQKQCPVKFEGRLSHQDTIAQVCSADFSIFYRKRNLVNTAGFPTKFAESISCGTPVITTNTSDLGQYLIDGKNGFFIDVDNTAESLARCLMADKTQLRSMKENVDKTTFDITNYENFAVWFKETINGSLKKKNLRLIILPNSVEY